MNHDHRKSKPSLLETGRTMRNIAWITAVAVVAGVGIAFLFGKDSEGPTQLAEDQLLGLKEHFKSLDDLTVDARV
jgi:hypothetical protein